MSGARAAALVLLAACGAPAPAASPGPGADPWTAAATTVRGDLGRAKVFDARGAERACEAPVGDCVEVAEDRDFLQRCKLAGFQVRKCGCELFCAGDVAGKSRVYDASGNPHECAEDPPDCSPDPAPAAFQDACSDEGHRLLTCDCAWYCSGKPAGAP